MHTIPETVVFDLGKVLLDFDYSIAARKIADRSRVTTSELARLVLQTPLLLNYETGLLTTDQFYREVCAATGFTDGFDKFASFFGDIFVPIEGMVQLHADLRGQGLPTFIFSNTNELAVQHIRRTYPFFTRFSGYALSYEQKVMKPDPEFYKIVEELTGCRGEQILYFDDRPENIDTGLSRGWRAVLHETPEQSRKAVHNAGLLRQK